MFEVRENISGTSSKWVVECKSIPNFRLNFFEQPGNSHTYGNSSECTTLWWRSFLKDGKDLPQSGSSQKKLAPSSCLISEKDDLRVSTVQSSSSARSSSSSSASSSSSSMISLFSRNASRDSRLLICRLADAEAERH